MKNVLVSLLLSLLTVHFSAAWAFGVGQVNAAAPEPFVDRCLANVRCETDAETKLTTCSRQPLAVNAPVADAGGKTAGGYHGLGTAFAAQAFFLSAKATEVPLSAYRFDEYHF
jgi:hypothetical protein